MGALLNALFGFVFTFFARYVSAKILIAAAGVTAFVLIFGALTAVFNAAMSAINVSMPAQFQFAMGIIPSNIPLCISTLMTCKLAIYLARVKWAIIKIKLAQG
jgi:hypothetical protein